MIYGQSGAATASLLPDNIYSFPDGKHYHYAVRSCVFEPADNNEDGELFYYMIDINE